MIHSFLTTKNPRYKLIALPTWVLTYLGMIFAPKNHPWKGKKFTLLDWFLGETPTSRAFDFALTVIPLEAVATICLILWRR